MHLVCPHCGSKDLWQPRVAGIIDRILLKFDRERYDCRKCRRQVILRAGLKRSRRGRPYEGALAQGEPLRESSPED